MTFIVPSMFAEHPNALESFQSILKTGGTLLWFTNSGQHTIFGTDLESNKLQESATLGSDVDSTPKITIVRPNFQNARIDSHLLPGNGKSISLVIDPSSDVQTQVSSHIKASLQAQGILEVEVKSLKDAASAEESTNAVFVILLELDTPFLYGIPKEEYEHLQKLLLSALDIVWVNFAGGTDTGRPEFSIVHGLTRALRNEYEELEFTVLSLEARDGLSEEQCRDLIRILFAKHISHDPLMPDSEYHEIGGALCIPRMFPAVNLVGELNKRYSNSQHSVVAIRDSPPLLVDLETPGLLDTLRFIENRWMQDAFQPDEIEVEVKAIGLNFRDCLAALGQLPNATFGQECAGIVVQSASTSFNIGDHVIAIGMGGFKTVLRSNATHAFRIPKQMPLVTAAAIPVQFGTAKEVIHRVARMQSGESILIHAGAGGTGQALIQVAQSLGAVVFATVSSQAKRDVLIKTYNIQESHIFYSRDTSFAQGIQRVTNGRGVDVVVNCLSGDSLLASWECLAPYGRFVEIGLKDIMSNANLPMMKFGSNTSFHGFDGSLWIRDYLDLARKGLEEIIDQFSLGPLHLPEPLIRYDVSDVEKALRLLQEGTSAGKVVVEISEDALVPVSTAFI
jgi:NADPH:quinone reductase-like Zn-dependent oxidoreductase